MAHEGLLRHQPILAVIFLLTLIATNTDFILASIFLRSEENYTLAVAVKG